MAFLKLLACRILLQLYLVTTAAIAYLENANVIQGRTPKSLYLEIIVSSITSLATVTISTIVTLALVNIMVFANARAVFGFQDGAVAQDTFHVIAGAQMKPALPHDFYYLNIITPHVSSILYALGMEHASVETANVKKYPMDNTRDSTVKILYGYKRERKAFLRFTV